MDERRERFIRLWERLERRAPTGRRRSPGELHEELEQLYSEPGRHYHTMRHIVHCLATLDANATLADDRDAVELALWFHDAIYEAGAPDNEARSAELFLERSEGALAPALRERVAELVMATVHPSRADSVDGGLISDVDLSGFALPRSAFLRDSVRVRREFADRDDAAFWPAQREFLDALTGRGPVFATPELRERLEQAARDNIDRYRVLMGARLAGREGAEPLRRAARAHEGS